MLGNTSNDKEDAKAEFKMNSAMYIDIQHRRPPLAAVNGDKQQVGATPLLASTVGRYHELRSRLVGSCQVEPSNLTKEEASARRMGHSPRSSPPARTCLGIRMSSLLVFGSTAVPRRLLGEFGTSTLASGDSTSYNVSQVGGLESVALYRAAVTLKQRVKFQRTLYLPYRRWHWADVRNWAQLPSTPPIYGRIQVPGTVLWILFGDSPSG
ncbi:hypothetical protein DFH06DRAFT_1144761 [Mycena polygramma]|nr:hypothetical protein DFH06DRAFT_1144761 [Mycena polygramma]